MKARNKFDYQHDPSLAFDNSAEPSMTMQQFARECDINYIVDMYECGQIVSPSSVSASPAKPLFGDFANVPEDLTAYYEQFDSLVSTFDTLPLEVKKACNYDPHKLLEIVQNPSYRDFLVEQGVLIDKSDDKVASVSDAEHGDDGE